MTPHSRDLYRQQLARSRSEDRALWARLDFIEELLSRVLTLLRMLCRAVLKARLDGSDPFEATIAEPWTAGPPEYERILPLPRGVDVERPDWSFWCKHFFIRPNVRPTIEAFRFGCKKAREELDAYEKYVEAQYAAEDKKPNRDSREDREAFARKLGLI